MSLAEVKSKLHARIKKEVRAELSANRLMMDKRTPYSPEYLAERAEFVKQWEALTKKGLDKNFLEWTAEYEGSHIEPVADTTYLDGRVFLENEQEFEDSVFEETERRFAYEWAKVRTAIEGREIKPELPKLRKNKRYARDIKVGMTFRTGAGKPFTVERIIGGGPGDNAPVDFYNAKGDMLRRWSSNVLDLQ